MSPTDTPERPDVPVSKETERRVLAYGEAVAEANISEVADGFTDPAEIDLLNHIGTLEGQVASLHSRLAEYSTLTTQEEKE